MVKANVVSLMDVMRAGLEPEIALQSSRGSAYQSPVFAKAIPHE
jgi:hypothetical protein